MRVQPLRAACVEPAQLDRAKVHALAAVGNFLEPKQLTRQGLTNEHPTAEPFDLAVGMRPSDQTPSGILHRGQPFWVPLQRRPIPGCGRLQPQRFVWALVIVDALELIEGPLLGVSGRLRRPGGGA